MRVCTPASRRPAARISATLAPRPRAPVDVDIAATYSSWDDAGLTSVDICHTPCREAPGDPDAEGRATV